MCIEELKLSISLKDIILKNKQEGMEGIGRQKQSPTWRIKVEIQSDPHS